MTKWIVSSRSLLLLLVLASMTLAFQGKAPQLPAPYHTPSASNAPKVIPRPDGAQLSLPKGFTAEVYSEGFEKPRFMALASGGEVLISDSVVEKGTVYVLRDQDKDGRAETKEKLIDGLDRPYGLAFWKDYLYVAEATSLKRYKYKSSTSKVEGPGEEVVPMKDFTKAHWTRTVLFDRKGEKMYLAIGSGSNVDAGDDPKRAAINRYNPDGSGHEIVASGLRNPVALRWYPGTDTLVGNRSRARRTWRRPGPRFLHHSAAWGVLRLALRLYRAQRRTSSKGRKP